MVVHGGGTIKKGRLINATRYRVAGSDISVARAANLYQATEDWTLQNPEKNPKKILSGPGLEPETSGLTYQCTFI